MEAAGVDSPSDSESKLDINQDEELYNRLNPAMNKTLFLKLLQKKRETSGNKEIDVRTLSYEKDPWDTYLMPEEPDPYMYDTFEGKHFLFMIQ